GRVSDEFTRRYVVVGERAAPVCRRSLAITGTHGELPHTRRDHGVGLGRARRHRPRATGAHVRAGDGSRPVAAFHEPGRRRRRCPSMGGGGAGGAGPRAWWWHPGRAVPGLPGRKVGGRTGRNT